MTAVVIAADRHRPFDENNNVDVDVDVDDDDDDDADNNNDNVELDGDRKCVKPPKEATMMKKINQSKF